MSTHTLAIKKRLALSLPERTLTEGNFESGALVGLGTSDASAKDRRLALSRARKAYGAYRANYGFKQASAKMLTEPSAQAKLNKSERYTLGLMLIPQLGLDTVKYLGTSKPMNLCAGASKGCISACLATSGHGAFDSTQNARAVRSGFLFSDPFSAGLLIGAELANAIAKHENINFRFNTVSDIRLELIAPLFMRHLIAQGVRLYDYTALKPSLRAPMPGYHLTYSAKESAHTSDAYLADILRGGNNVAMPFQTKGKLPDTYTLDGESFRVINGDLSDDRTEDPLGVIVGLTVKGNAGKKDTSGFIRQLLPIASA